MRAQITKDGSRFAETAARSLDGLAIKVAATLRRDLVLEVDSGETGPFHLNDGSERVRRAAKAGIGIGEDWHARDRCDPCGRLGELGQRRERDVGDAEQCVRQRATREVERRCARLDAETAESPS